MNLVWVLSLAFLSRGSFVLCGRTLNLVNLLEYETRRERPCFVSDVQFCTLVLRWLVYAVCYGSCDGAHVG